MAKRGYFQKGKSAAKGSRSRTRYASGRGGGSAKRGSSGRGATGRRAQPVAQTIRIVFAQEPGGAAVANPALPIPMSVTTDKTRKAKL